MVDASAMPYVTNGNIYAPVMMLAEKAADLVAGNTPLPPDPVEFYRHDPGNRMGTSMTVRSMPVPIRLYRVPRCGPVPLSAWCV